MAVIIIFLRPQFYLSYTQIVALGMQHKQVNWETKAFDQLALFPDILE